MNEVRTVSSATRPDRLGLKLTGLFLVSMAFALLAFMAYGLLASVGESAAVTPVADQTTIVIDPKIEEDLTKVLAFDSLPAPDTVRDPFGDRGGLSRTSAGGVVSGVVQPASPASSTVTVPSSGGSRTTIVPGSGGTPPGYAPPLSSVSATKQRYETWLARLGVTGDAPLDPTLFAIEDLLPVGIVDGGSEQQEVMFFSEAAGKTVSFPIGTMFYDGWLIELRPEGVLFSSNDERKTLRMRSWARSLRNAG